MWPLISQQTGYSYPEFMNGHCISIHPPKKNDQEYQILLTEELKKYLRGNSLPGTHKLGCWLGLEISV